MDTRLWDTKYFVGKTGTRILYKDDLYDKYMIIYEKYEIVVIFYYTLPPKEKPNT